ncbi:hypothetical protein Tco_0819580 [Tanacetum coccineum]|uniref:Uncharacterized protein n=1 Tax=Tanacetum coccineum TaxID=301880 RepID=A0ABQ5ABB9_9ASTR
MASHRLKSLYAIKECSTCGSLYTKDCCSIGSLNDKILVPEPDSSPRCARCGTPVDGPSCRGCAFLRKKFDEDLLAYCVKNGIFKDFQDTFEPSDDNTNVVNALREPCVVNQDPGEKSSQEPPQIDHNVRYFSFSFFEYNSLSEFETFSDDTKETNVGSITTTHANYSLPEYESFHFDNLSFSRPPPEPPDVEISLDFESDTPDIDNLNVLNDEPFDPREGDNVVFLNDEEDDSFTFTSGTFLPFCPPYPRASPYLHPTGSEDDESLLTLASPLEPLASHREGNFHFA